MSPPAPEPRRGADGGPRRLAVFGAAGRTGRHVVELAAARGHQVVAVARRPPAVPSRAGAVTWRVADVLDPASIAAIMGDVDAVIVAVGPAGADDARTCGEGTRNVVAAARAAGVRRIACVTGAMIGHPVDRLGWILRRLRAAHRRAHPAAAADRDAQERAVADSGLDWTVIRPSRLAGGVATAALVAADAHVPALAASRRADVAAALVAAIEGPGRGGVCVLSRPPLDRAWLARWTAAFALAEVLGLGLAGGGLIGGYLAGLVGASAPLTLALAALAGAVEGAIVGGVLGALLTAARPEVSFARWLGGTVLGATVAWCAGMTVPLAMGDAAGAGGAAAEPPVALQLLSAAGLGAVAGVVLAGFQAPAVRACGVRARTWLAASAAGWAVAMPLAFVAADRPWTTAAAIGRGAALVALMGAVVGLATGLALRRAARAG